MLKILRIKPSDALEFYQFLERYHREKSFGNETQLLYLCRGGKKDEIWGYVCGQMKDRVLLIQDLFCMEVPQSDLYEIALVKAILNYAEIHGCEDALIWNQNVEFMEALSFLPLIEGSRLEEYVHGKKNVYQVSLKNYFTGCS